MAIKSLAISLVTLLGFSTPGYAQCDLRDRNMATAGGDSAHTNMQPSWVVNKLIKL